MKMKKTRLFLIFFLVAMLMVSSFNINLAFAKNENQTILYKISDKSDKLPFKGPDLKVRLPKDFDGEAEVSHKILDKKVNKDQTSYKIKSTAVIKMKIKEKKPLISFGSPAAYAAAIIDHPGESKSTITGYVSIWYNASYQNGGTYIQVYDQSVHWERGSTMYSLENCYYGYSWHGWSYPDDTDEYYKKDTFMWSQASWTSGSNYKETESLHAPSYHWDNFATPISITYGQYLSNTTGATAEIWDWHGYNYGQINAIFSF